MDAYFARRAKRRPPHEAKALQHDKMREARTIEPLLVPLLETERRISSEVRDDLTLTLTVDPSFSLVLSHALSLTPAFQ